MGRPDAPALAVRHCPEDAGAARHAAFRKQRRHPRHANPVAGGGALILREMTRNLGLPGIFWLQEPNASDLSRNTQPS